MIAVYRYISFPYSIVFNVASVQERLLDSKACRLSIRRKRHDAPDDLPRYHSVGLPAPACGRRERGRSRGFPAAPAGARHALLARRLGLEPKLKGSIGEGSNHPNFSDQSSVKILSE